MKRFEINRGWNSKNSLFIKDQKWKLKLINIKIRLKSLFIAHPNIEDIYNEDSISVIEKN